AILVESPYGPFGGVPFAIRFDRGWEFLAEAVMTAAGALAIDARPLRAYSPHLKGTCERTNESIEQLFLAELPGFTHGPRDRKGRVIDPSAPLLPLERLVELFVEFVNKYNTERPHEGLGGRTPLQRWEDDPTPLHVVAPERLRHLLLARTTRTVDKKGVRLDGRRYNHEELCGWGGEKVEVRHMPHHHDEVEIFVDGRHLCTAKLGDRLSPAEARRLVERHAEEARWLSRQLRAAGKRRRVRYAAMTEPRPPVPVTAFTESAAAAEFARNADNDRRRLAMRSLVEHGPVPARMIRPVLLRSDAS
ncbi:MAG: Mu transposase C-terminal domain-containing protein, partial [Candidatus Dormibacteria bacterium]